MPRRLKYVRLAGVVQPVAVRLTATLVRAHQRDSSQIARLTDLVSELVRSAFGG